MRVNNTAIISGITGQDSHYLCKNLLASGQNVVGISSGKNKAQLENFAKKFPTVKVIESRLSNLGEVVDILKAVKPSYFYNLGALSSVKESFEFPEETFEINYHRVKRIIQAIKVSGVGGNLNFYQASSSEMFGSHSSERISEESTLNPQSPYAESKALAHEFCINSRKSEGLRISCGILFNHESPLRGEKFLSRKVVANVVKIQKGLLKKFSLGDLSPVRDWGYAPDYVQAMQQMCERESKDDFVIATGVGRSVEEFVETAFRIAGIDKNFKQYLDVDKSELRPRELISTVGNPSKAKSQLGWEATTGFERMVEIIYLHELGQSHKTIQDVQS